jgi:hypothetical protein
LPPLEVGKAKGSIVLLLIVDKTKNPLLRLSESASCSRR